MFASEGMKAHLLAKQLLVLRQVYLQQPCNVAADEEGTNGGQAPSGRPASASRADFPAQMAQQAPMPALGAAANAVPPEAAPSQPEQSNMDDEEPAELGSLQRSLNWRNRLPVALAHESSEAADALKGFCYALPPARLAIQQPPGLRVRAEVATWPAHASSDEAPAAADTCSQDSAAGSFDSCLAEAEALLQQQRAVYGRGTLSVWDDDSIIDSSGGAAGSSALQLLSSALGSPGALERGAACMAKIKVVHCDQIHTACLICLIWNLPAAVTA